MDRKDMTGVLFIEEERKSDKHPVLKGEIKVEGKDFQMAVWKNISKNDKPYYSVKISEPFIKTLETESTSTPKPAFDENDIPF
jgi:uncharacterized protein (DUF736 family)